MLALCLALALSLLATRELELGIELAHEALLALTRALIASPRGRARQVEPGGITSTRQSVMRPACSPQLVISFES